MSPRKLTEDDKQEILKLYRNSAATTSTLAVDYGVSSSTISRFLKNKLSQVEYEDLIQQKRLARTPRGEKSSASSQAKDKSASKTPLQATEVVAQDIPAEEKQKAESSSSGRRRRRRSSTPEAISEERVEKIVNKVAITEETQEEIKPKKPIINKSSDLLILKKEAIEPDEKLDVITLEEMLGEEIDDDDDDDDDDDWELENDNDIAYPHAEVTNFDVEILPLSSASFPRTCYLVIDRAAELIVKPLEDFADLGSIPKTEVLQQTLPIFDNHRVAKRFSHRRERVIKVPDGRMIHKTSKYLYAKGITRLLLDGQIYSLDISVAE